MKYLLIPFLLLILFTNVFSQVKFSGKYKLNADHNSILQLHCGNIFILDDSLAIGYGKWYVKNNNQLILEVDSIAMNNRMDREIRRSNKKIVYNIEDGRIFRNKISKKEYRKLKKEFQKIHWYHGETFGSFSTYKANQLKTYYQKTVQYSCE
jgi:hypothetical protein